MVKPAARARRIAMPPRDLARGSDEAVFKLISTTKSRAEAKGMVRYVARARKSDRDDPTVAAVKLRDGEGEVLSRTDAAESFAGVRAAVDGAFEGLELTPEAENLKKDAAPAPPAAPPGIYPAAKPITSPFRRRCASAPNSSPSRKRRGRRSRRISPTRGTAACGRCTARTWRARARPSTATRMFTWW